MVETRPPLLLRPVPRQGLGDLAAAGPAAAAAVWAAGREGLADMAGRLDDVPARLAALRALRAASRFEAVAAAAFVGQVRLPAGFGCRGAARISPDIVINIYIYIICILYIYQYIYI